MARARRIIGYILILVSTLFLFTGCQERGTQRQVVIYTSVDQQYSEPVLMKFEQQTGIKVLAVYDVEAAKTTGLVNRLIAEQGNPQADVFWNSEFAQTMLLKDKGVLASYQSPSAQDIPANFRDAEYFWTGFGGRARILLINTNLVKAGEEPRSVLELAQDKWPAPDVAVAYPLFGTSATHAAALYSVMGAEPARDYYQALAWRGVQVVDGNSVVRDLVVQGRAKVGLTDTDDAYQAVQAGAPVKIIVPDQEGMGALIIPNTVALIAGAPHDEEARALVDFLLSPETEADLTAAGFIQAPLRAAPVQDPVADWARIKCMNMDYASVYGNMENAKTDLTQIFVR